MFVEAKRSSQRKKQWGCFNGTLFQLGTNAPSLECVIHLLKLITGGGHVNAHAS